MVVFSRYITPGYNWLGIGNWFMQQNNYILHQKYLTSSLVNKTHGLCKYWAVISIYLFWWSLAAAGREGRRCCSREPGRGCWACHRTRSPRSPPWKNYFKKIICNKFDRRKTPILILKDNIYLKENKLCVNIGRTRSNIESWSDGFCSFVLFIFMKFWIAFIDIAHFETLQNIKQADILPLKTEKEEK